MAEEIEKVERGPAPFSWRIQELRAGTVSFFRITFETRHGEFGVDMPAPDTQAFVEQLQMALDAKPPSVLITPNPAAGGLLVPRR